jgi:hypothetical protein
MSASACYVYYGLRFEIVDDEIEGLETRSDFRLVAARRAKLKHFWGNFGGAGELHLLFVGAEVGALGPENDLEVAIPTTELIALMESTNSKLKEAGFTDEPALYLRWLEDV